MNNKKAMFLVVIFLFACIEPALSGSEEELIEKFEKAFSTGSFSFMESDFTSSFLSSVPIEQMNEIAKEYGKDLSKIRFKSADGNIYVLEMVYKDGSLRDLTVVLDSAGKIAGLWLGPVIFKDAQTTIEEIESLPGSVSVMLRSLSDDRVVLSHNPDDHMAIGSAFKLYVLAELFGQIEEGKLGWNSVIRLKDSYKSLPSGILQTWPAGTPVTVATLANLMISISDNTATDILIRLVGRENIERDLANFGHEKPELNIPFLTTNELFKLKWGEEDVERYLNLSISEKREFLDSIYWKPLPPVENVKGPVYIDTIEWFASSNDITRFFQRVWEGKIVEDPELRTALMNCLAINPGIPGNWEYMGYKGGSEPGVLSLNWLFGSGEKWFALSFIWNNPEEEVDLNKALGIAMSLMDFANNSE